MNRNGQDGGSLTIKLKDGTAKELKFYVEVVFTQNPNTQYSYTYEVPDRFARDIEHGHNLVAVEGRGGMPALAYVIGKHTGNIPNGNIKQVLDVCTRVRMKPECLAAAERAKSLHNSLF